MPKKAVFERSRRELSLDVSVGVHILLVVGQSGLESQSRGCAKTRYLRYNRRELLACHTRGGGSPTTGKNAYCSDLSNVRTSRLATPLQKLDQERVHDTAAATTNPNVCEGSCRTGQSPNL